MKSNPVKISGKLFRYDFDHAVVEYICKADADIIAEENEWKANHGGRPLFGIDETGHIVCATAGLNVSNWKDAYARQEYLSGWAAELDEEAERLADDFVKYEMGAIL